MRVLIGIPSPRDIPEFTKATIKLDDDKLWAKYYDEYTAYRYIRKFFLKHTDYTHLCLLPDDLIVEKEQYEKLKEEAQGFHVLSGVFNSNYLQQDFMTHYPKDGQDIIQVEAEGFGCCFMRRDVVEKITFDGKASFDISFAIECRKLGIPIFVDTSVKLFHLARRNESNINRLENIGIGFFVPCMLYQICLKNQESKQE